MAGYPVPDGEMLIAEDALISDVQFAIHNLLVEKEVSRADLARRMDVTDAYVSQLFKDRARNLTLKTLARIFRALDEEPRITSETLDRLIPGVSNASAPEAPWADCFQRREEIIRQMLESALSNEFEVTEVCKANDNDKLEDLVAAA